MFLFARAIKYLSPASVAGALLYTALTPNATASIIYRMSDDMLIVANDNIPTVGVQVNECHDEAVLLWQSQLMASPLRKEPEGSRGEWRLEEEGFSPPFQALVKRIEAWKKMSISEKVKAAPLTSRQKLGTLLRQSCKQPESSLLQDARINIVDERCPQGGRYYEYETVHSFFGIRIGSEKGFTGCLSDEEAALMNIQIHQGNQLRSLQQQQQLMRNQQMQEQLYPRSGLKGTGLCNTYYGVTRCN